MSVSILRTNIVCEDGNSILAHLCRGDKDLVFNAKNNIVLASVSAKDSSPDEFFLPAIQEISILRGPP